VGVCSQGNVLRDLSKIQTIREKRLPVTLKFIATDRSGNALNNIVGPDDFVAGGHHDVGTRKPWLLGVDFGNSGYEKYTSTKPIKAVFTIKDSEGGRLVPSKDEWSFIPEAGFTGRVTIPFSVFDGVASDDGSITIDVLLP